MDYVVGSVAALISGNVTPNRPKLIRRALTPTKHQPSPNVTPKSEMVDDRSIFLSPTLQKKKAIVKKSPKRIFENPDLDTSKNMDGNCSVMSPKAERVKKHLKDKLEDSRENNIVSKVQKSPKNINNSVNTLLDDDTTNKEDIQISFSKTNENTPKKKKKRQSLSEGVEVVSVESENLPPQSHPSNLGNSPAKNRKSSNKLKEHSKSTAYEEGMETDKTAARPSVDKVNNECTQSKKLKLNNENNPDNYQTEQRSTADKMSKSQKKRLKKKLKMQMQKGIKNQSDTVNIDSQQPNSNTDNNKSKSNKNKKLQKASDSESKDETNHDKSKHNKNQNDYQEESLQYTSPKKYKKNKQSHVSTENQADNENENPEENYSSKEEESVPLEEVNKKSKNKKSTENTQSTLEEMKSPTKKKLKSNINQDNKIEIKGSKLHKEKKKNFVNPNAVTDKDSDSEHESDNEIDSENEQINIKALESTLVDQSSDEEIEEPIKKKKKTETVEHKMDADEIKRTLFVGNVPFSAKCKKQIKKIFNKYGKIITVRIRTVPVKDARVTPKLAVIRNELHPERTTVNMYIKYADPESVEKALIENNTTVDEHHIRVTRSDHTGAEHDSRLAIFVGNLPFAIEDDTFRAKFEKCGEIESVRIIRDKKTNAGKGFGYVNFASKDGVELALALSEEDLTIKNRILRVKRCTPMTQKQSQRPSNPKWGPKEEAEGALRRLMHKRNNQDAAGDGPPNKRPKNVNQPLKEKKPRKEFVGMTAEKKKKHKFDKGQKKKKVLSQILKNKS